jgi:hypothetical protein
VQSDLIFFNLRSGTNRNSTHRNLTPGASNPRASEQLGVWEDAKRREEIERIAMVCSPRAEDDGRGRILWVNRRRLLLFCGSGFCVWRWCAGSAAAAGLCAGRRRGWEQLGARARAYRAWPRPQLYSAGGGRGLARTPRLVAAALRTCCLAAGPRWAPRGWAGADWVGPSGSAQVGKDRFCFFNFVKPFPVQKQLQ